MKSRNSVLIVSLAIFLTLVGSLYWFIVRPRLAPLPVGPVETERPVAPLPDGKHAVLNLYFHSPLELIGISRMELTLVGITAYPKGGEPYSVFEGSRRVTLQHDVVQKIASEEVYHGELDRLVLTFGPTVRIMSADRSIQTAFLPNRSLSLAIGENLPLSRTMNVLLALPKNTSFGEEGGVITLQLPSSTESEHALLGGVFLNGRSVGEVYAIPDATIRDAILADIGLDIAPRDGARGSTGFGSPDESQPEPAE